MSGNKEKTKPEKNNFYESNPNRAKDSEKKIYPNQLKFNDILVRNEDSISIEELFLPHQSSENIRRGVNEGKQSIPLFRI